MNNERDESGKLKDFKCKHCGVDLHGKDYRKIGNGEDWTSECWGSCDEGKESPELSLDEAKEKIAGIINELNEQLDNNEVDGVSLEEFPDQVHEMEVERDAWQGAFNILNKVQT